MGKLHNEVIKILRETNDEGERTKEIDELFNRPVGELVEDDEDAERALADVIVGNRLKKLSNTILEDKESPNDKMKRELYPSCDPNSEEYAHKNEVGIDHPEEVDELGELSVAKQIYTTMQDN
jgi:hypothetical protein